MNVLKIPCEPGEVSDGYHTFNELYEHRHALALTVATLSPMGAYIAREHDDGSKLPGWFLLGIQTPKGFITYHLPDRLWAVACMAVTEIRQRAYPFDGHTSKDVIDRLYHIVTESCLDRQS